MKKILIVLRSFAVLVIIFWLVRVGYRHNLSKLAFHESSYKALQKLPVYTVEDPQSEKFLGFAAFYRWLDPQFEVILPLLGDVQVIGFMTDFEPSQQLSSSGLMLPGKDALMNSAVQFYVAPKMIVPGKRSRVLIGYFKSDVDLAIRRVEAQGYRMKRRLPSGFVVFEEGS